MSVTFSGVGGAVPGTVVDNTAFADLGVDDAWIVSRTGVLRRHHLAGAERLVDLAVQASAAALADAGVGSTDIDFVVAATTTADRISPGLAPEVAHVLGIPSPGAIDLSGACTGLLYGLDYASARVAAGRSARVLVIGADAMTRITDRTDRNTAVLFGDGAGAVVVEAGGPDCPRCPQTFSFGSAGQFIDALYVTRERAVVEMNGGEVYKYAVAAMAGEITRILDASGVPQDEVDLLVCHQANARILSSVARQLSWPPDKVVSYVDRYGNTSSASIPLALAQAQLDGVLRPGRRLALSAFGAGLTWGAGLLNWKGCRHAVGRRPTAAQGAAELQELTEVLV